jgi:predicted TIM-barrel fold metal-dependent hydrolase
MREYPQERNMPLTSRRTLLQGALATGFAPLLDACQCPAPSYAVPKRRLVDAHCHIFNASDLPVQNFISIVFAKQYEPTSPGEHPDAGRRAFIDALVKLLEKITGDDRAPTAAHELAVLEGREAENPQYKRGAIATAQTIASTAQFLKSLESQHLSENVAPDQLHPQLLKFKQAARKLINKDQNDFRVLTDIEIAGAAKAAVSIPAPPAGGGKFDFPATVQWFQLYKLYRYEMAAQLADDARRHGFDSILLTPAMIDFSAWLRETVKSPFEDQIAVMGALAKKKFAPSIHGYVSFCPLRAAYFRHAPSKGPKDMKVAPLDLVKAAIGGNGFIGVKVYPPMGFWPADNDPEGPYIEPALADLGNISTATLAGYLNAELAELYQYCAANQVPILAHAANSQESNENFGMRADPAGWVKVMAAHPDLRLCLGHFGSFNVPSATPQGSGWPEKSWEWTTGHYIKDNPACNLVIDVSYYAEILYANQKDMDYYSSSFKSWIQTFDPNVEHVLFGTDWNLMGHEPAYPQFLETLYGFLKNDCGLSQDQLDQVMYKNALKFLHPTHGRDLVVRRDEARFLL